MRSCRSLALPHSRDVLHRFAPAADPGPKPLKALLVTGGCCHDYDAQKDIIKEGLESRAHIEVTVVRQGGNGTNAKIPLYEKADWSKGYDIVLHDECFADVKDPKWTAGIIGPHGTGLPGVVIHCRDALLSRRHRPVVRVLRRHLPSPRGRLPARGAQPRPAAPHHEGVRRPPGRIRRANSTGSRRSGRTPTRSASPRTRRPARRRSASGRTSSARAASSAPRSATTTRPSAIPRSSTCSRAGRSGPATSWRRTTSSRPRPRRPASTWPRDARRSPRPRRPARSNFAALAVDGDPATRWCANRPDERRVVAGGPRPARDGHRHPSRLGGRRRGVSLQGRRLDRRQNLDHARRRLDEHEDRPASA